MEISFARPDLIGTGDGGGWAPNKSLDPGHCLPALAPPRLLVETLAQPQVQKILPFSDGRVDALNDLSCWFLLVLLCVEFCPLVCSLVLA